MVDIECPGGHSHHGGDDTDGTASYCICYYIDGARFGQLRRASGKFSSFVLLRVVRLTIETNALTGTSYGKPHTDVYLTCFSASLAITILVLYVAFPVSRTEVH
jgi:hypothetical protein